MLLNIFHRYEWDEEKRRKTLAERGIDFADMGALFRDKERIDMPDEKHSNGEKRRIVVGTIKGRKLFVVYTKRLWKRRIISARSMHEKEWRKWHEKG